MSNAHDTTARLSAGDQRLEDIIATAEAMFFQRGYRGVSIRDLAAGVGVQMSSLYYYFPSKADILHHIISEHLYSVLDVAKRTMEINAHRSHVERLQALIRESVIALIEERMAAGISTTQMHELPGAQQRELLDIIRQYQRIHMDLIRDGIASGEFIEIAPDLATYPIVGAEARLSAWFRPGGRLSAEEVADTYAYLLTRAIATAPDSLQPGPATSRTLRVPVE